MKKSPKIRVSEFLNSLKSEPKEKGNKLRKIIADAESLVKNNEFGVALEITLDNLYEYQIPITPKNHSLATEALRSMNLNSSEWECLNEIVVSKHIN